MNSQVPVPPAAPVQVKAKKLDGIEDLSVREATPVVPAEEKQLRRAPINDPSVEPDELTKNTVFIPKSTETKQVIMKALKGHYLFSSLDEAEINEIMNVMSNVQFDANADIIIQGTPGNVFYILEAGSCAILVNNDLVGRYASGDAFGELALLYNCPRAATIRALAPCSLWTVDRTSFRKILATTASTMQLSRVQFLQNVDLLQRLSNNQLQKVAAAMKLETFADGTYIIRQGEEGHLFYIVVEGTVHCTTTTQTDGEKPLMTLTKGQYFGEMALMLNEPRQANCIAKGKVACYVLGRTEFTQLLGPLRSLLDRQMRIRVLRSVPLLNYLTDDELDLLAHALRVVSYQDKEQILRQGDAGDTFFIISDGKVSVKKAGIEIMQLRSGEFFGERALLSKEPRAADCFANGHVECLCLDRSAFEKLLGKLEHILIRETKRQQLMQEAVLLKQTTAPKKYRLEDFDKIQTIGTGTFGRVLMVKHRPTGQTFAMKCMLKVNIVETHQQRNVVHEKNIINECDHPFILKLHETFADADQLYMLLELVQGGELWSLLYEKAFNVPKGISGAFDIASARFYVANVVETFRYLQTLGVAYRDLKPENLMIDDKGYLKMVDFGFAKHIPFYKGSQLCERSFTLCGTPEYLAPELVLNKGHGKAVDYWALGCLVYELIAGRTPFQHQEQQKIFEKIIHAKMALKFHPKFDPLAQDLITKLLEPNPGLRLGSLAGGMMDVVNHPWFTSARFDWKALVAKTMRAPYVPMIKSSVDVSNFDRCKEGESIPKYTGEVYFHGF
ncbi:cGMP-dependent protein kinase [Thraustotheca clavata]|uniref:cGMP-dependent protein kinase n=1 Tax=Thraustotheca clavata TaxID=74557 RepID=A0A1V9ZXA2_9STRA|nr:cGMP-dependent protein kinase [Thraustotheca clavata]